MLTQLLKIIVVNTLIYLINKFALINGYPALLFLIDRVDPLL